MPQRAVARARWPVLLLLGVAAAFGIASLGPAPADTSEPAPDVLSSRVPVGARAVRGPPTTTVALAPVNFASAIHLESDPALSGGAASGWVTSAEDRAPIPGAELTFGLGGTVHTTRTGADGRFEFRPSQPGEFLLLGVTAAGFEPHSQELPIRFDLVAGRRVDGVRLQLSPRKLCPGWTVFEDGGAAAGAALYLPIEADDPPSDFSDDAGFFEFDCRLMLAVTATLGPMRTVAQVHGENGRRLVLGVGSDDDSADLDGGRVLTIEGRVLGPDSLPVVDQLVEATGRIKRDGDDGPEDTFSMAMTEADGRFVLRRLVAGTHVVTVMKQGLNQAPPQRVEAGSTNLLFRFEPEGSLEVRVSDERSRAPLTAFKLRLVDSVESGRAIREQRYVGAHAVARMENIPAATYSVWVRASGYEDAKSAEVTVKSGATARVEVRVRPGGVLRGRVRDAETFLPIPGATVAVSSGEYEEEDVLDSYRAVTADSRGQFEVDGFLKGGKVTISAAGYRPWVHLGAVSKSLDVQLRRQTGDPDAGREPEFGGVGLIWGWSQPFTTLEVVHDSPAEHAGIQKGDVLLKVNGEQIQSDWDLTQVVALVRGELGTPVRLSLARPDGGVLEETLVRARIISRVEP